MRVSSAGTACSIIRARTSSTRLATPAIDRPRLSCAPSCVRRTWRRTQPRPPSQTVVSDSISSQRTARGPLRRSRMPLAWTRTSSPPPTADVYAMSAMASTNRTLTAPAENIELNQTSSWP